MHSIEGVVSTHTAHQVFSRSTFSHSPTGTPRCRYADGGNGLFERNFQMLKALWCSIFHRQEWDNVRCDQFDDGTPCSPLRGYYCHKCDAVRNIDDDVS